MGIRLGSARTGKPLGYLRKLCNHWGHQFEVQVIENAGKIDLGDSSLEMEADVDSAMLRVILTADPESLDELQNIVVEHINRLAHREGNIEMQWHTSDQS
jgi:hypothetical protein